MKNESQTVLAVSLSRNDEAPLTRAILCSPCEKHEEQKRQCDLHLVRLILTQLREIRRVRVCMGRKLSGGLTGGFHKSERGTQRGRKVSCLLEILLKLDDLFLQRKINKAISLQAHDSKEAKRDFLKHLYTIMEIIY